MYFWFLLLAQGLVYALSHNSTYSPRRISCPNGIQWIRPAVGLNPKEAEWVHNRKTVVTDALEDYLHRVNLTDFDVLHYIEAVRNSRFSGNPDAVPMLGIAISGGGFVSGYSGTGILRAMDGRLRDANEQKVGGLLQSITYLSGLSGGSFPVVSFSTFDFPTADDLLDFWKPQLSLTERMGNQTMHDYFLDVANKADLGYNVSTSDFFARLYAGQFVPGANAGAETTWSGVVGLPKFKNHTMPFPIINVVSLTKDDKFYPQYDNLTLPRVNDPIYDYTPFEFGAWDGPSAFTPTEYLGTPLDHGRVASNVCTVHFDNAGFVIASTSAAINMWMIEDLSKNTVGQSTKRSTFTYRHRSPVKRDTLIGLFNYLFSLFKKYFNLTFTQSAYTLYPNPFLGLPFQPGGSPSTDRFLRIVDGAESGQNIPLWGQIQPARQVDFVIAVDGSGDAQPYGWQNGTNLYDTYRAASAANPPLPFPVVPPPATFVGNNYTNTPILFGCHSNLTTTKSPKNPGPLVLYVANAPYSSYTNYTFSQTPTSVEQMSEIFTNSFNILTQGNSTLDAEWPAFLACAAIDRSVTRLGMKRTLQCERALQRYCWDGHVVPENGVGPTEMVDLPLKLTGQGFGEWIKFNPF